VRESPSFVVEDNIEASRGSDPGGRNCGLEEGTEQSD